MRLHILELDILKARFSEIYINLNLYKQRQCFELDEIIEKIHRCVSKKRHIK